VEIVVRKLSPEKSEHWDLVSLMVEKAAPPTVIVDSTLLSNVRKAMLEGSLDGWVFSNSSPIAAALTTIREDPIFGKKEMIIYAAMHLRKMSDAEWDGCFRMLRIHSIVKGCTHIGAYTVVQKIMDMGLRMGGNIDTRYISIPLGGTK